MIICGIVNIGGSFAAKLIRKRESDMKKILSIALCAVLSLIMLSACGEKDDNNGNIAMEDLEYGATLSRIVDSDIEICYDKRFFTEEEMRAVSSYYYAIQTKDTELFMKTQSESYVEYVEKNSGMKTEDFIKNIYDSSAASLGEGFEYVYIEAVGCGDRTDDLEIDEIISLMDEIYEESGKEGTFKDSVNSAKYAVFDFMAENNGSQYTLNGQKVYIFDCTDGIYIYTAD